MGNTVIDSFWALDLYDPDLEYDYKPLKAALKQEWVNPERKNEVVRVLDDLAKVGEIDDPRLCEILSESYELGIGRQESDNRLAEVWKCFAGGDFNQAYDLIDRDVDKQSSVKEGLVFDQMLAYLNDPRAMRFLIQECMVECHLNDELGVDTARDANRNIFYSRLALHFARYLQSEDAKEGLSDNVVELFFNEQNLKSYRETESRAWFERGLAYRKKWLMDSSEVSDFRAHTIASMKKAANLGDKDARYLFPAFVPTSGCTNAQIDEAACYAKNEATSNPEAYLLAGNKSSELIGESDLGTRVVCVVAQSYAEGLGSFDKDEKLSHHLFEIAARYGSEWAEEELGKFEKHLFGGWRYVG